MTRILITGATGFVGSHILEAAMAEPELTPIAALRAPDRLIEGFDGEIRQGDLTDSAYRAQVVEGVDVLCHAAAWTSLWGHAAHSDALFLTPTLALIDAAIEAGVKRLVFLSSTSVAAPHASSDPMSEADPDRLGHWPHLRNVARIEAYMRTVSGRGTEMTVLRAGIFAGARYGIGLLPILVPRLRTHLVPWVAGGRTGLPIIGGADLARAFLCAARAQTLPGYQSFNIVGPEVPQMRDVVTHLSKTYGLPKPHFSVPFPVAYGFARAMELIDPLVPWEPLVTRSIIHLLEETGAGNARARDMLGYVPEVDWRDAIGEQMHDMLAPGVPPMKMAKPLPS